MSIEISESHQDLLEKPLVAVLATTMPNGQPHTSAVWRTYDGNYIRVVTSRGTQKEQNMQKNQMVSLIVLDPENPYRYLELRGYVENITEEGAMDQLDKHTQFYTDKPAYYGHIEPAESEGKRVHVICEIKPTRAVTVG